MKKKENKYSEKKIILIYRSPICTERNILHYRVAQQSINSKNKSGWQSFSFIGEREITRRTLGLPSVVAYERKEREEERGGDKMKKRGKGGKNWKGKRERERGGIKKFDVKDRG